MILLEWTSGLLLPFYGRTRRTLHTGADLLTTKQTQRLHDLFTADEHIQVEVTWGI